MGNKAQRIADEIKRQLGAPVSDAIRNIAGALPGSPSPGRQKRFIRDALTQLNSLRGRQSTEQVMRACGRLCISNATLLEARRLYREEGKHLDPFLHALNIRQIGGGRLRRNGETITAEYETCYCGAAQKNKGLPEQYCACSEGWFEQLFSFALEREVSARRLNTILAGGACCLFEISIYKSEKVG